jgi:iron(III) transport system permease protein
LSRRSIPTHGSLQRWLLVAVTVAVVLPPLAWLAWALLRARMDPLMPVLDPVAQRLLARSVQLAGTATLIALAIGLPYGWTVARCRLPGGAASRRLLRAGSLVPLLIPPYVAMLAWNLLLAREGPVNRTLVGLGWVREPFSAYHVWPLAAAMLAFVYWPVVGWLAFFAFRSVPRPLEDAARLEVGDTRAGWWSAGPSLAQALPAAGLLVFLLALADFGVPNALHLPTYPVELVNQFQVARDAGVVVRLALPLPLLVVPLVALQRRWLARLPVGTAETAPADHLVAARWRWPALLFCLLVLGVTVALPLGMLAAYSLPLRTYGDVWRESQDHLVNTLLTAGGGALLAVVLAVGFGWAARGRRWSVLDTALTLPYALPASLIGVALIRLMNGSDLLGELYDSLGSLVWAYAALFFPFAHKSLAPAWGRVSAELLDEGRVLGAGDWTLFRTAAWPVLRPYAVTGGGIVALMAAREIDATALIRPPDGDTLAFRIYDYLHFAPGPKVAALSISLVSLSFAIAVLLALWASREAA